MSKVKLTLQTLSSPIISEILCLENLDGVVLDTEHGIYNLETLISCIQIINLRSKKCFVRITDFNKTLIRNCLDAGADGIIFSTIDDNKVFDEIKSYCSYPKFSGRRGCALSRENNWGKKPLADRKPLIIAQIETQKSVDNLFEISKCDYDYFIIGPYDLSSSLGCPGDFQSELFKKYINRIVNEIDKNKLGVFLPTENNINSLENLINCSTFHIIGMDTYFISSGYEKINLFFESKKEK